MFKMTAQDHIARLVPDCKYKQLVIPTRRRKELADILEQQAAEIAKKDRMLKLSENVCKEAKMFCENLRNGKPQTFHGIERALYWLEKEAQGVE